MNDIEITLLSEEEIWGIWGNRQLDVLKKYGTASAITDLAILTGAWVSDVYKSPDDNSLKGRAGYCFTRSSDDHRDVCSVNDNGSRTSSFRYSRSGTVRPALLSSRVFSQIFPNASEGYNGVEEVEYGEYPQYAPDARTQKTLEDEYKRGRLQTTGRDYTFDKTKYDDCSQYFQPVKYEEYEYCGRKYIRVKANFNYGSNEFRLSNGEYYRNGNFVWVEISPVKWLVDRRAGTLLSKVGLLSGIRFHTDSRDYNGDFKTTDMKEYLDKYMLRDLTQGVTLVHTQNMTEEEKKEYEEKQKQLEKRRNPYGLNFKNVSEEDLIRSSIESDIPVFLHGRSSDGKSARIKAIDPKLEIIYLRNATPDSLNGKSVYNSNDNKMIDIKPSWLERLENKCSREPDKIHILFFDELTNSLPSIQGMAFNIILDREVNARIVAAGNEMSDSLAANKMAEPLFNRFAHVYIKTNTKSWLVWASNSNIHPAIFSFIAYKKDKALRTEYNGETPNADPRKWEMASKMLYKTNNPESLRCLVGSDITREFIAFCKTKVITLDDVLNDRVTDDDINSLNVASKYATVVGLTSVSSKDSKKVREFLLKLGAEYRSLFDSLRINSDDELEELMEEEMKGKSL